MRLLLLFLTLCGCVCGSSVKDMLREEIVTRRRMQDRVKELENQVSHYETLVTLERSMIIVVISITWGFCFLRRQTRPKAEKDGEKQGCYGALRPAEHVADQKDINLDLHKRLEDLDALITQVSKRVCTGQYNLDGKVDVLVALTGHLFDAPVGVPSIDQSVKWIKKRHPITNMIGAHQYLAHIHPNPYNITREFLLFPEPSAEPSSSPNN